ncbi:hypothetical protein [Streptomyces sp. ITFR-6]|uniref:hypothetical protein n=1 Tax=Streptomyces sp. ITFR-6 TaxID=3075197 RepID=UPI00288A5FD6|nr:hypothetical protein [Streptomyces sp. ITFR-6]WNI28606.1 hypothetical protein RLT59_07270 [Streptomyces sp. ITFR-6]
MNDRFLTFNPRRNSAWTSNSLERHVRTALATGRRWSVTVMVWENVDGDWRLIEDPNTYFAE